MRHLLYEGFWFVPISFVRMVKISISCTTPSGSASPPSSVYSYTLVGVLPRGVSTGLRNRSKQVRTPVALLRSISGKYPQERCEPPYPPSYGLNSTTTVLLG